MTVTPSPEVWLFIPPMGRDCAEWERPVGHLLGGGPHGRPDSGIALRREMGVCSTSGQTSLHSLAGLISEFLGPLFFFPPAR